MGGKSGSSGNAQRAVTQQEKDLWSAQEASIESLTKIGEEQYNISAEDRDYYEKIFREGSDTEAKTALAKLKSTITGTEVSADSIKDVSIDSLLRDTILTATPEFAESASKFISSQEELTKNYGAKVTGLSSAFSKSIEGFTNKYSNELQNISDTMGTANKDILATQTGTSMAGISSGYAEARKQLESTLARKGLTGSGVEANILSQNYQQEAMNKASAGVSAYNTAVTQSDAQRTAQAQILGQQYQTNTSGIGTAYNANLGATQNVYGVTSANDLQNYNVSNAATLQGIAGLTQIAQAGTGVYSGAANYLQGASATVGQAAGTATSAATSLASTNSQYATGMANVASANGGQNMELLGTLAGAGIGAASDIRLKTNIELVDNINGHNIYTWDWIEGFDGGYNKGVIAQEVLEVNPEAIVNMDNGFYAVNYDMLGLGYLVEKGGN